MSSTSFSQVAMAWAWTMGDNGICNFVLPLWPMYILVSRARCLSGRSFFGLTSAVGGGVLHHSLELDQLRRRVSYGSGRRGSVNMVPTRGLEKDERGTYADNIRLTSFPTQIWAGNGSSRTGPRRSISARTPLDCLGPFELAH
jgi:hypothetical protein